MTAAKVWVAGARPRTLPAAIVPVAVGTGVAVGCGSFIWWRALLALVVSLALQIGVNYANDYSDGIKGTDKTRVGPARLVGSGLAAPKRVLAAALSFFLIAGFAGLALAAIVSWWLLAVGAGAIAAAWFYTGGSRPYGYRALGEVSVFAFFGLAAVIGTAYVQVGRLTWISLGAAIPVGLLACALLVINNLRDIPTDEASGKRTLAVVLGDRRTRQLYTGCVLLPFVAAGGPGGAPPPRPARAGGSRGGTTRARTGETRTSRHGRPRPHRRSRPDWSAATRLRRAAHGRSGHPPVTSAPPFPPGG